MIRINLLPVRISKRQEAVRQEVLIAAIGLFLLLGGGIAMLMQLNGNIDEVKSTNAQMSQEIEVLNQTVRRVEEVDQLKSELQLKLDIITRLKANKTGPVHMLAEISLATPEKLTLTSLHEENHQLSIEGYALSPEVISNFMSNLDTSDWFTEIYLIEMEGDVQDGRRLNTFSIQASLVIPGANDAAETEEEPAAGGRGRGGGQ